jgi:sugar (pentulose or hexulose) kinase
MGHFESSGIDTEKARLAQVEQQIEQAVASKEYDRALILVDKLTWEEDPQSEKAFVEQYDKKREQLRQTIEKLKKER